MSKENLENTELSDEVVKTDNEVREEERQAEIDNAGSDDEEIDLSEDKEKGKGTSAEKEPERFKLNDDKPEDKAGDKDDELFDIIHNGQAYKLTKEKIIALAQKGFDYDYKVGPHGKLVQMIEADPDIAKVVSDYWQKKLSGVSATETQNEFKVKPLDEYENESAWLMDNIKGAIENFSKKSALAQTSQPDTQRAQSNRVAEALQLRDPEFFHKVLPKMAKYAGDLSVSDYARIDSDMGALCKFYDYVKGREFPNTDKNSQPKKPRFSIRSGGGEAPPAEPRQDAVWKLPKADFQKQLDKIKGYG